ncbi:MAG: ABC transporter ATP-binding protein [Firmicutes bacterium]|nr:ABC transporter ATP-binding protein [Bacillota bacterium]
MNYIDETTNVIQVTDLKKYYHTHATGFLKKHYKELKALDGVTLAIRKGEILGVVGESGCGKSTLGRAMMRLFPITDGQIIFNGVDISHFTQSQIKPYRRDMQMIFQNPFSSFNPKKSIGSSLTEVGRVYKMPEDELNQKIAELLDYIRLPQDMLRRAPKELSGGQLQRLAVARALLLNPSFIVADEPVSALDVSVQAQILNLIIDLRKVYSMTMMFVSHEMTVVEHTCDRVAVMYLGKIVELAPTKELFRNILHPYTKALISAVPRNNPSEVKNRIILEGDIPNAIDLPAGCRFAGRCRECTGICKEVDPPLTDIGGGHYVACHRVKAAAQPDVSAGSQPETASPSVNQAPA